MVSDERSSNMIEKEYLNKRNEEYQEHVEKWLGGIRDEISFWNAYMREEGGYYFYGFKNTVSPNKRFELEEDIPKERLGEIYKFVDVGSGPFSRCGRVTSLVNLEAVSVDPLAYAYKTLRSKYGIDNGVELVNGFVELLDKVFTANTFDMVHMSNSLDHCFAPVDGILQLLNICKVGGKVILRHTENEAINEKYKGLHQWNLSLLNPEKSFVIWRGGERIDICKLLCDYANFELYPNQIEKGGYWVYNKVVMVKKKDITLPSNEFYDHLLDYIYRGFINLNLELSLNDSELNSDDRMRHIRELYHKFYQKNHNVKGIEKVAVYGYGKIGKNLCYLLKAMGIEVTVVFDKQGKKCGYDNAISIDDCNVRYETDMVIVSIQDESVVNALREKGYRNIVLLDDFLSMFD